MGRPERYKNLKEDILNKLNEPMSTTQIKNKFKLINWRTIYIRLHELHDEGKINKIDYGNVIIWKKL